MKIKAIKNFSGLVTMSIGEERNVRDGIADDLVRAGYDELVAVPGVLGAPEAPEIPEKKSTAKKSN